MSKKRRFIGHSSLSKKTGASRPYFFKLTCLLIASNKPTHLALKQKLGLADIH